MDGLTFLKEKAAIAAIKDIPVVIISTESGTAIVDQAKSLGAVASIKKPFTPDQINAVISPLI